MENKMETMPIGQEFVYNHPRSIYAKILHVYEEWYVIKTTRDTPTCEKDVILTSKITEIEGKAILVEV